MASKNEQGVTSEQEKMTAASEIIAKMNSDEFIGFQHELEYALTYHRIGHDRVQLVSLAGDVPNDKKSQVVDLMLAHGQGVKSVTDSSLYMEVRKQIKQRFGQSVPNDWTGWISYDVIARDNIIDAIDDVFHGKEEYGIYGMIIFAEQKAIIEDRKTKAEKTIKGYGIEGTFINPDQNLVDSFLLRWGQKPTTTA